MYVSVTPPVPEKGSGAEPLHMLFSLRETMHLSQGLADCRARSRSEELGKNLARPLDTLWALHSSQLVAASDRKPSDPHAIFLKCGGAVGQCQKKVERLQKREGNLKMIEPEVLRTKCASGIGSMVIDIIG